MDLYTKFPIDDANMAEHMLIRLFQCFLKVHIQSQLRATIAVRKQQ